MTATYTYKAINKSGENLSGQIEASSVGDAKTNIQNKHGFGIHILKINKKISFNFESTLFEKKLSPKEIIFFTEQLCSLSKAGLSIPDCLDVILSMSTKEHIHKKVSQIIKNIHSGMSFSESCNSAKDFYSPEYIALIKAGEHSGSLDETLTELSNIITWKLEMKKKVKGALRYPAIVISAALFALWAVFTFVIPKFSNFFSSVGEELPKLTQILLNTSTYLSENSKTIFIIIVVTVITIKFLYKNKKIKFLFDKYILKAPIIGSLLKNLIIAQFCKVCGILYSQGASIIESLEISEKLSTNSLYQKEVSEFSQQIREGQILSQVSKNSSIFSGLPSQMIATGEKSGNLGPILKKTSIIYSDQIKNDIEKIFAYLEPALIIILGFLISCLIIGIFLPMMSMMNAIQNL